MSYEKTIQKKFAGKRMNGNSEFGENIQADEQQKQTFFTGLYPMKKVQDNIFWPTHFFADHVQFEVCKNNKKMFRE